MAIEKPRRRFSFKSSEYHMKATGNKRQQTKRIMTYGIKHKRSPKDVLASLKAKGLGYRKKDFLNDYAHAEATEFSKTHQSYKRANIFWHGVERIKKRDNIKTYSAAVKALKNYQYKEFAGTLNADDIKALQKLADDGEYIFGTSPIW